MATSLRRLTPSQIVVLGFIAGTAAGALLLSLPISYTNAPPSPLQAIFTTVAALCLAGLGVVDISTFFTPFGHLVILALMQIGAFGIMTIGSLLGLLVTQKVSFKTRINSTTESSALGLNDFRKLVIRVFEITFLVEGIVATVLAIRFVTEYHMALGDAIWYGIFHAVSAFCNCGYSLFTNSMIPFQLDPIVLLALGFATVIGGLGFPVLVESYRRVIGRLRGLKPFQLNMPVHWSLQAQMVFWMTVILLLGGWVYIAALEWANPQTIGAMSPGEKLLNALFISIQSRSAGMNSFDLGVAHPATLLGIDLLMFIGAASAGTSGGIKVTTFAVIIYIVLAEIKGAGAVNVGQRRLPRSIQRQALSIAFLSTALVLGSVIVIHLMTDFTTDQIAFEVISAFGTVGLSTGITAALPAGAQLVLIVLMFVGRVGLVLVASALAVNATRAIYQYPKERPIIG